MFSHGIDTFRTLCRIPAIAIMGVALFFGCATTSSRMDTIASGDTVQVNYTCRIEDGSILVTTRKEVAHDASARLSHAYIPPTSYAPVMIPVGKEVRLPDKPVVHPLTGEIAVCLSKQLEGLTYEDTHHLTVTTEAVADLPKMERYMQYARTMRRPKQRSIPKAQFVANTGQEPVAGATLFADRAMPWKVLNVSADSVEVQYLLTEGQKVMMPYGEAMVRDRGDHYDLEIEVRPGDLVRVGSYIGRIVDISDKLFFVDFEHPFGGRELACEVTATHINESPDRMKDPASEGSDNAVKNQ
ncbi:hypothetical protein DESC_390045 [Desulfosarcina cetonica]|nr:hypothetical protein DESC_390045 [Desulfosarcina cetonica]